MPDGPEAAGVKRAQRRRRSPVGDGDRQRRAYDAIRQDILDANYPGGAPLSEYQLAKQIGVSRTPVREALKRLQQEGLVRAVARRGTFVSELSVEDIIEIYEIRDQLEVFAASTAAARMDPDVARALRAQTDQVAKAPRSERIGLARAEDLHLHKEILSASANRRLVQIVSTLDDQVHRIRSMALARETRIQATLVEHAAIIDAIIRRDAEGAGRAMRTHLRAARANAIQLALGGKQLEARPG